MSGTATLALCGRLTRDAEMRTVGESVVIRFSVATDHREKKDGQWMDAPSFWDVDYWIRAERGDKMAEWLTKGQTVSVSGEAWIEEYTGKDGQARRKVKLRAAQLWIVPGTMRHQADADAFSKPQPAAPGQTLEYQPPAYRAAPKPQQPEFIDDIPF